MHKRVISPRKVIRRLCNTEVDPRRTNAAGAAGGVSGLLIPPSPPGGNSVAVLADGVLSSSENDGSD